MRCKSLSAALLLMVATATGQWIDRSFWIPDSLPGIWGSDNILVETGTGRVWFAGCDADQAQVFDPNSGTKVARLDDLYGVSHLARSPASHRVYAVSPGEEFIAAIDDRDFSVTALIDTLPVPFALAYCSREDKMYVGSNDDALVWVFDPGPDTVLRTIYSDDPVWALAYDSTRNRLFTLSEGGGELGISVYDCTNDSLVGYLPTSDGVAYDLALYLAMNRLYSVGRNSSRRIEFWTYDLDSLVVLDTIELPSAWNVYPLRLTFNPTTGRLYAWYWELFRRDNEEDSIAVLNCATGAVSFVAMPEEHYARTVTAAGSKTYVTPWEAESVAVLGVPDSITDWIRFTTEDLSMAGWDPARNEVYVADDDDRLHIVDVASDSVTRVVDYSLFRPFWFLWNPAGKMYAGSNRDLAAFGPRDSLLFRQRIPYSGADRAPAWSAELNRLYFAFYDTMFVWDCSGDTWVRGLSVPTYARGSWAVPGRNRVYVPSYYGDTVFVYDTYRDTLAEPIIAPAQRFVHNPRTGLVYGFKPSFQTPVCVIDPRADTVVASIEVGEYTADFAVNTRDNEAYALMYATGVDSLLVFDGNTHQRTRALELPNYARYLCYVEEWSQLLAFGDTCAWVLDCPARQVDRRISVPRGTWSQFLWNPRNDKLYAGPGRYWDTALVIIRLPCDSVVSALSVNYAAALGWNPISNETYVSGYDRIYVLRDEMTGLAGAGADAPALALRVRQNPSSGLVRFGCSMAGPARLAVYDMTGRLVWSSLLTAKASGIVWDRVDRHGRAVPSGVYVARLESSADRATVKVVLE